MPLKVANWATALSKLHRSKRIGKTGDEKQKLQSNAAINITGLTALAEQVETRPQRWRAVDSDDFFPDLAEETDKLIHHYESPNQPTNCKIIDVAMSSLLPLPDDLQEEPTPEPAPANKRDCQPSNLPTPEVEKWRCTGALEEFQAFW